MFQIPIFQFSHLFWNQTLLIFLLYVRVHLPFIWKTSFCMGLIFRKLWGFLFAFLNKFTTFKYLTIPSLSLCTVFDVISSNTDEIISFNPSANLFVFGGFKVHHHSWQRIPTCPLFYKASPLFKFCQTPLTTNNLHPHCSYNYLVPLPEWVIMPHLMLFYLLILWIYICQALIP